MVIISGLYNSNPYRKIFKYQKSMYFVAATRILNGAYGNAKQWAWELVLQPITIKYYQEQDIFILKVYYTWLFKEKIIDRNQWYKKKVNNLVL